MPAAPFDLSTPRGRFRARWAVLWRDHGVLRLAFRNAHRVSEELWRSNQPWPHQLARWQALGVKTVVTLRGGSDDAHHLIEKAACEALGLGFRSFRIGSREPPTADQVAAARRLFEDLAYPALIHCKSGSDRTGVMGTLYLHLRKGLPMRQAMRQLGLRYGHLAGGETGIADYVFARYAAEGEPAQLTLEAWLRQPGHDAASLLGAYRAGRGGWALDRLLGRE